MILHIKKGYHVHVEMTRDELKRRGFRFRTFRDDSQRFGVYLTEQGKTMYANAAEAMLAIVIAYDKIPQRRKKDEK